MRNCHFRNNCLISGLYVSASGQSHHSTEAHTSMGLHEAWMSLCEGHCIEQVASIVLCPYPVTWLLHSNSEAPPPNTTSRFLSMFCLDQLSVNSAPWSILLVHSTRALAVSWIALQAWSSSPYHLAWVQTWIDLSLHEKRRTGICLGALVGRLTSSER